MPTRSVKPVNLDLDLFPEETPRKAAAPELRMWSVSDLNRAVRSLIEEQIGEVWVQGEVCNYRRQSSGHQYFGLKDERASLACVLFQKTAQSLRGRGGASSLLADGMLVQLRGQMTVYETRGQYQLVVQLVQPAGAGLLQARFEALKRKLDAEGLFAVERKRALPKFPATIGIVTSPTGAAVRDMLHILERRASWVRVVISPVRVQGDGAAAEIAAAIGELNEHALNGLPAVEVIVVCRGGGSAEDLWAFNEEAVARAIFDSAIPVVSAVGHEIDFTIVDFVADLRAPTPSAAAELIVPDASELARWLAQQKGRLQRELVTCLAKWRARLVAIERSALFRAPQQRLGELWQRLDHLEGALRAQADDRLGKRQARLLTLLARLREHRPDQTIGLKKQRLQALATSLSERAGCALGDRKNRVHRLADLLRVLSPTATLSRGYTITAGVDGKVIHSVDEVRRGMRLRTLFADGEAESVAAKEGSRAGQRE